MRTDRLRGMEVKQAPAIIIPVNVLATLSQTTQAEILNLFAIPGLRAVTASGATPLPVGPPVATTPSTFDLDSADQPADMSVATFARFMAGVSARTSSLLRCVAEKRGRALITDLLKVSGDKHWRQLAGFLSGVTRRARRILRDPGARLLVLEQGSVTHDSSGELTDGVYVVAAATLEAMRKFFKL